jgi:aminoglycoside phosphotransferase family enzyme/predicted kinase
MPQALAAHHVGVRMELAQLIEGLSDPAAYPHPVKSVEVRHTHISAVFLADHHVYKVKKPVNYGFVDFGTLAKRRHFCEEEVRLNRRLAPEAYLGVVPVTCRDGRIEVEGSGEVVEWAVKMQRLPDGATLQSMLQHSDVSREILERLARRIAAFHAQAESGPKVAAFGRFKMVAANARENFEQSESHVGATISRAVFERARALTEIALADLEPLIERRADRNVPRDTHGDLRLGHVYYFTSRQPPHDFVIIDCIEFNERFRFADPISDMAFLVMGLAYQGRRDLAQAFADSYFSESRDIEGRMLLPFYVAYRAAVRGKVEGLKLARPEISTSDRQATLSKARGSWLLGLGEMERPGRRPCLVVVGGLPGTGKSTIAHALANRGGFRVIRSDVVRKELAGVTNKDQENVRFGDGIYSAEWTERTYAECLRQAEDLLFEGARVLVDANFRDESHRQVFLEAATRWGVPGIFLCCEAAPDVVRKRLASRRDDISDADWPIYLKAKEAWQQPGLLTCSRMHTIETGGTVEQGLSRAYEVLRLHCLLV